MEDAEAYENNMKAIIKALKEEWSTGENNERWMDSKTGWDALTENSPLIEIADSIVDVTQRIVHAGAANPQLRRRLEFSIIRKNGLISPWRKEEALERLLTAHHADLRNQYAIGGGKESIDLIRVSEKNEITEIFELKHDCGNDTPLYATIELLKNYFLLVKNEKDKHLSQLVLLANTDYYKKYKKSGASFRTILGHISSRLPEKLYILPQVVDCGTPKVVDAIRILRWDLNWLENNDTQMYDEIVRLNEEQVIELAQQVGGLNLELRNVEIQNKGDWSKV